MCVCGCCEGRLLLVYIYIVVEIVDGGYEGGLACVSTPFNAVPCKWVRRSVGTAVVPSRGGLS